jgi:hypothetical protein
MKFLAIAKCVEVYRQAHSWPFATLQSSVESKECGRAQSKF